MGKVATRASDERLVRMLSMHAEGATYTAIARREKVSVPFVSREIEKVRQDDIAQARDDPPEEFAAAYQKERGRRCG